MKRFERCNHAVEVIDVLPVNNQVYGECDAPLPDLTPADLTLADLTFADPTSQFDFMRVGARSGNPGRRAFAPPLKPELSVVEARFNKLAETLARKADSRSDQVSVQ